ncbi:hypothetical protein TorRG33x02_280520 [Trema orientale]|uniref:Uncharacterized protein n=1 Tax=Trema orientale TaxID=63057 RepID=A0A2P5CLZ2_TREOI|nr:hypothetical protein TorRG33x02_280520 [Trema orientale]
MFNHFHIRRKAEIPEKITFNGLNPLVFSAEATDSDPKEKGPNSQVEALQFTICRNPTCSPPRPPRGLFHLRLRTRFLLLLKSIRGNFERLQNAFSCVWLLVYFSPKTI